MSVHCKRVYMSKAATAKPPTLWRLRLCACVRAIHTRAHAHTSEYLYECMVENVGCPEIENRRRNKVIYCLKIEKKPAWNPPNRHDDPNHNNKHMKEQSTKNNNKQFRQTHAFIHSHYVRPNRVTHERALLLHFLHLIRTFLFAECSGCSWLLWLLLLPFFHFSNFNRLIDWIS